MHFGIGGSGPRGASLTESEKEILQICYLQKSKHKYSRKKYLLKISLILDLKAQSETVICSHCSLVVPGKSDNAIASEQFFKGVRKQICTLHKIHNERQT